MRADEFMHCVCDAARRLDQRAREPDRRAVWRESHRRSRDGREIHHGALLHLHAAHKRRLRCAPLRARAEPPAAGARSSPQFSREIALDAARTHRTLNLATSGPSAFEEPAGAVRSADEDIICIDISALLVRAQVT